MHESSKLPGVLTAWPARAVPADWMRDEVAIDFPSMRPVVERIRDGFLADLETPPVTTSICLSSDQAFRGLRVPLVLPVRRTCEVCGGRGEVWNERCLMCDGAGDAQGRHEIHVRVPARVKDGTRLRYCVAGPGTPATVIDVHIAVR